MAVPTRRESLWDSSSDRTSDDIWIGDATQINLYLRGSPSTTTVEVSNDDGFTTTIDNYSTVTTNTNPGPDSIDIEPGPRWMRVVRSETTEGVLQLREQGGYS